jgi:hypothetical protein
MVVSATIVIEADVLELIVLLPEVLRSAPAPPTPLPLRVRFSLNTVRPPEMARVAPEATVVPPVVPPSAVALPIWRVPAETVVLPV